MARRYFCLHLGGRYIKQHPHHHITTIMSAVAVTEADLAAAEADACCVATGHGPSGLQDPTDDEILADPTMASCCVRDILQQRKSAALR